MALRLAKKKDENPYIPLRKDDNDYSHMGGHDESNWLVSYADMMTLLCCFFILLFSMSKLDPPKYEKMRKEVSAHFNGKYEAPPTKEFAKFLTEIIDQAGTSQQATVKSDETSVTVAFQSTLFFDKLSADLTDPGRTILDKVVAGIQERQKKEGKNYRVVVEGHTDSQPIVGGTYPSNWELSGARATRVVRQFIEKGFGTPLLTAIAYGDTRPELPSRMPDGSWDEQALAKNRRVVIRILDPAADSIPIPEEDFGPPLPR